MLETLGRNWYYRWAGPLALALDFSAKTRNKEGRQGFRLWPLRCLSQFLPTEREYQLLRGQMFLRTFHRWGDLIYSICFSQIDGGNDYFPFDGVSPAFIVIGLIKG